MWFQLCLTLRPELFAWSGFQEDATAVWENTHLEMPSFWVSRWSRLRIKERADGWCWCGSRRTERRGEKRPANLATWGGGFQDELMLGPWRNLEFRSPCHRAQLGKCSRNTFLEDGECGSDTTHTSASWRATCQVTLMHLCQLGERSLVMCHRALSFITDLGEGYSRAQFFILFFVLPWDMNVFACCYIVNIIIILMVV